MAVWREMAEVDPTAVAVVQVLEGLADIARVRTERRALDFDLLGLDMWVEEELPTTGAEILGVGLLDTTRETNDRVAQPHPGSGWQPVVFLVDDAGWTELGDYRAVQKLHHRVHDRLRMHHHIDLFRIQIKQPSRFDHLQGLIHHCGRIDRNLRAHVPGWMRQGIFNGHCLQLARGSLSERTTTRS